MQFPLETVVPCPTVGKPGQRIAHRRRLELDDQPFPFALELEAVLGLKAHENADAQEGRGPSPISNDPERNLLGDRPEDREQNGARGRDESAAQAQFGSQQADWDDVQKPDGLDRVAHGEAKARDQHEQQDAPEQRAASGTQESREIVGRVHLDLCRRTTTRT